MEVAYLCLFAENCEGYSGKKKVGKQKFMVNSNVFCYGGPREGNNCDSYQIKSQAIPCDSSLPTN